MYGGALLRCCRLSGLYTQAHTAAAAALLTALLSSRSQVEKSREMKWQHSIVQRGLDRELGPGEVRRGAKRTSATTAAAITLLTDGWTIVNCSNSLFCSNSLPPPPLDVGLMLPLILFVTSSYGSCTKLLLCRRCLPACLHAADAGE